MRAWIPIALLLLVGGCSDEAGLTPPEPWNGPVAPFPVSIAPAARHLVDAEGTPFMIQADSAWSLISSARREAVDVYLRDRRSRRFNAFDVVLIDHTDPLVNAYGEPPFQADGDFSTPNEAYFAHADWVISRANAEGFLVWLSPIYLGYQGGDEGFYSDVVAAGPEAMRAWGRWVGERYRDVPGLVWLMGGDYVPPAEGLALLNEVVAGIKETDGNHYFAAHWARQTSGWEVDVDWLDLNTTYSAPPMYLKSLADREGMAAPMVMLEGIYENEYQITLSQVRAQAYEAMLAGSTGHFFGSWPIWKFADDWRNRLASDGAICMTHLRTLFDGIEWWTLAPDTSAEFLVSGRGNYGDPDWVSVARNDRTALIYLPAMRQITIDLASVGRSTTRWFDPTSGSYTDAGAVEGTVGVSPPGPNSAGDPDWILLVEVD